MSSIKKTLFPIFSVILVYQCYELTRVLMLTDPSQHGLSTTLFFAFLLTLYITGVFAFVGFAYPTNRLIPNSYYKIRNASRLTKVSRGMGIKYFKAILLLTYWGAKKNRMKYFNGTKAGLENFIYQTKQSEFGHLVALIFIFILSIPLLFRGYYNLVLAMTAINIVGNLYPIILQRMHRIRIGGIVENSISKS